MNKPIETLEVVIAAFIGAWAGRVWDDKTSMIYTVVLLSTLLVVVAASNRLMPVPALSRRKREVAAYIAGVILSLVSACLLCYATDYLLTRAGVHKSRYFEANDALALFLVLMPLLILRSDLPPVRRLRQKGWL